MITTKQIKELILNRPSYKDYLYKEGDKYIVTQEWLCGTFAGRSFEGDSEGKVLQQLIEYLYRHLGHQSMVGKIVDESGFPDLDLVESYCTKLELGD